MVLIPFRNWNKAGGLCKCVHVISLKFKDDELPQTVVVFGLGLVKHIGFLGI